MPSHANFQVEFDESSKIVGGFTLEDAIEVARDLKQSGKSVRSITQGGTVVLDGDDLARLL